MGKIIAVAADKGGTGKTATVLALSQAFAKRGYHVWAVDLDPQANLTKAYTGRRGNDMQDTLPVALRGGKPIPTLDCGNPHVTVVPTDISLAYIEDDMQQPLSDVLHRCLASAVHQSDFVFLDCPPGASNRIAYNALSIADYVLIPATADDFSVDAVDTMQEIIATIPSLSLIGIVITMYKRNGGNIYKAFEALMRDRYGDAVLNTCVRDSAKFKEKLALGDSLLPRDFNAGDILMWHILAGAELAAYEAKRNMTLHADKTTITEYDYWDVSAELLNRIKI